MAVSDDRRKRRQEELERGAQRVATEILRSRYDPTYPAPNSGIDPATRRRRDEYRARMGAQVDKS